MSSSEGQRGNVQDGACARSVRKRVGRVDVGGRKETGGRRREGSPTAQCRCRVTLAHTERCNVQKKRTEEEGEHDERVGRRNQTRGVDEYVE